MEGLTPAGIAYLFTAPPAQHSGKDVFTSRTLGFLFSLAGRRHSFDRCSHLRPLDRSSPLKPLDSLSQIREFGVLLPAARQRAEVGITRPPVDAYLFGLVHGGDQEANLDREKFDVNEFDLDVPGNDHPFVEDAFEDTSASVAL